MSPVLSLVTDAVTKLELTQPLSPNFVVPCRLEDLKHQITRRSPRRKIGFGKGDRISSFRLGDGPMALDSGRVGELVGLLE